MHADVGKGGEYCFQATIVEARYFHYGGRYYRYRSLSKAFVESLGAY